MPAAAGEPAHSAASPKVVRGATSALQTVVLAGHLHQPVRVLHGAAELPQSGQRPQAEVVSFGGPAGGQVTVIRGRPAAVATLASASSPEPTPRLRAETVSFADPNLPSVTVVRGAARSAMISFNLFGPANAGELDRVAFAVDGIESRHGADLRMWRPEPDGPQGPMQVSAKAAIDVGGGDRYDMIENRLMGRAYLTQMYRRYGNWPDALAAYNWGPGNVDEWIAGGRQPDKVPPGVVYYVNRALRDALITTARW